LKHDALRLDSGPPVRSHLRDRVRPPAHRLLTGLTNHTHTRPERGAISEGSTMPSMTFEQRLFSKIMVDPADPHACWIWTATTTWNGYGQVWRDGRMIRPHRATYELYRGTVPPGMFLDHTCHTRNCVNPEHLRIVTHKQNLENLSGARRDSRSGVRGVRWRKDIGRWRVEVKHNGRRHHGGYFDDLDEAAEAARQLRLKLFPHNDADRKETAA